eukprot:jgi/Tetstr1/446139/TSEL_033737.t1
MQKEVEKELRSQNAAEERARVEADILRRKRDKKVARLKAKIRLMFESNGSEAESAGSEGSGSDEEVGGQKPERERPAGLSCKLREATTRATVRKFIGRQAEKLKAWLNHAVGNDDIWQSVYAEGGPGAQFGAPSGGDGGAEPQQQHGDVDARGDDGEEAGILEEADLVGQRVDRLINLNSSKWDADMEKLVHMVLPYGNFMIRWPSVEDMLKGQGGEMGAVGLSTMEDMISSTLDLKLIFMHTVSENCDKKQLQVVGQYCYDHMKLIISEDIYLQTEKGVKKPNVAAESWPGATCQTMMLDNYETLLQKAIPHHTPGARQGA